jgi:uncharacterized membrane protein
VFMRLTDHSGNTSVVALTARFAVSIEQAVIIAAVTLQPIGGFALSAALGLPPFEEF